MEIREFVRNVLEQVLDGVVEAQKRYPSVDLNHADGPAASVNPMLSIEVHPVDFDMAVEVEQAAGGKSGLRVAAFGLELGRDAEEASERSRATHRVKFSVPVTYPYAQG